MSGQRSFWPGLLLVVLRCILLLCTILAAVATALPALRTDQWLIRYLGYPTLQFLVASVVLAVALLLLPTRGWLGARTVTGLGVALLVLTAGWNAVRLAPYLLPLVLSLPHPAVAAGTCPAEGRLRVFEANVQMTNEHDTRLLDMVRAENPDIAWFQETDAWWEDALAPLSAAMPHGSARAQPNYFGVHLFSRLPLEDVQVQDLTNSRNPSISATATLPSGRKVRIHAIHPRPPQVGQSTAERDAQLMAAALQARADPLPHLIVGDLNTVPWEGALHRTEAVGGVGDPRIGRGPFITWNATRTFAKWPLDHILPGPGFTLSDLRVLPPFGSDHQPLVADLCVPQAAAGLPPLDDATLADTKATIARGQGKATQPGAATPPGTESGKDKPAD